MKQRFTEQDAWMTDADAEAEQTDRDRVTADPEEQRLGLSMLAKTALGVFVVVALIISISNVMKFNQQKEKEAAYRAAIEAVDKENGRLQNLLDAPMDDEYIARLAQERLGLGFSDEKQYHNNLN